MQYEQIAPKSDYSFCKRRQPSSTPTSNGGGEALRKLLSQRVMARTFNCQMNELKVRAATFIRLPQIEASNSAWGA